MQDFEFRNPFRPGAGHMPPYLAGREPELEEFSRLLTQDVILENPILTGLRGVGKTVLLETFKPMAQRAGWLWVGTDLSESASVTESSLTLRVLTDVSIATASFVVPVEGATRTEEKAMEYQFIFDFCEKTPGLFADKMKATLELVHEYMPREYKGIIFAYDEAQSLADHASKDQYPLSMLLEVFQSLQRKEIPFMLLLTGLPTLFPKLVESRTYAERMFRILFLDRLNEQACEDAILKPIAHANCPIKFTPDSVETIKEVSGGYPFFIQFICREVYDVFLQGQKSVPIEGIIKKLDSDFFAGRWTRATERQRDLLWIIANMENAATQFSVQDIVGASKRNTDGIKPLTSSHTNQMLSSLSEAGLIFKKGWGSYSFAVPLLHHFIRRQGIG